MAPVPHLETSTRARISDLRAVVPTRRLGAATDARAFLLDGATVRRARSSTSVRARARLMINFQGQEKKKKDKKGTGIFIWVLEETK